MEKEGVADGAVEDAVEDVCEGFALGCGEGWVRKDLKGGWR